MREEHQREKRGTGGHVVGDVVKGAIAGAAGVWLMDRVGWFLYRREDPGALARELAARPGGKDPAGIAVHYALGVVPGALYAPLRRRVGRPGAGRGLLYGLGLFLVNDELFNPVLGLSAGPAAYSWQAHARGLAEHLVLGVVTEVTLAALNLP